MENIEGLIERYKNKMRLLYGCDVKIIVEDNKVMFKGLENYNDSKFIVPEFVQVIGREAFKCINELEEVVLGKNVYKICDCAFSGCKNLISINLNNVEIVGKSVFYRCKSLREVNLPVVKYIGAFAFNHCKSLRKVSLSEYIEKLPESLFDGCSNITEVTCKNLKVIDDCVFTHSGITGDVIKEGIEDIGAYAFHNCTRIKNLVIPGSVEELNEGVFMACYNIRKIKINDGVKIIHKDVFKSCKNIKEIQLPRKIRIHKDAFSEGVDIGIFKDEYNIRYNKNGYIRLLRKE